MKTISHRGKVISMTNEDHAQMLRRFDPNRFKVPYHGSLTSRANNVSCPLCAKYADRRSCSRCPFDQFGTPRLRGCIKVLNNIVGWPNERRCMALYGESVGYFKADEDKAVKQLNLVMDFLNQAR